MICYCGPQGPFGKSFFLVLLSLHLQHSTIGVVVSWVVAIDSTRVRFPDGAERDHFMPNSPDPFSNSEVKRHRARLVVRWGTTREVLVLRSFFCIRPAGPTDKARDYGSRDTGFESQVGLLNPDYSSVGRAIDCRSIGHQFDSG